MNTMDKIRKAIEDSHAASNDLALARSKLECAVNNRRCAVARVCKAIKAAGLTGGVIYNGWMYTVSAGGSLSYEAFNVPVIDEPVPLKDV